MPDRRKPLDGRKFRSPGRTPCLDFAGPALKMPSLTRDAGIAQLVERNLAKVEVASSSLVSRSKISHYYQIITLNISRDGLTRWAHFFGLAKRIDEA